ncbi:DUF3380 domain-containing protein [Bacteroides cellulosilyticus]|nr:N-acetylmuramidase domain-containing protein [Bacteroides cellulosilyticus]RGQ14718.1 DUF3380 domain-containing protein [Bacteroides cellulosilyticus]RGU24125.1 DUF3380 domain-containing protein [Bacteroides cellulosilyticus]UVP50139.1 N-acetylmuramidase family protein [Bacteroides cellulosilyticus]
MGGNKCDVGRFAFLKSRLYYKGGISEYDRLEQTRKINRKVADASVSWGMFQIIGFNYAICLKNI